MAYVIVLEGRHKSGKTTLAQQIEHLANKSGEWQSVVNIHHTRGDSTPEKLDADRNMIEDSPSDKLYIFDRHYLSELVYAPIVGRTTTIRYDPLYWEQYMGKWIDQRGMRLYLMGEPIHTDESPITQMYERLTARTGWMSVEPREFIGDALAKDVLQLVYNRRQQNETWGFAQEPDVTAKIDDRRDDNYLCSIETVAGLERGLYALRKADGTPESKADAAATHYREIESARAELDETLLAPFRNCD